MKKIILIVFSSYFLASFALASTQCPTGQNFNGQVNRCLTTAQTARIQEEVKNKCKGLSGEAHKNCYYQTATTSLEEENVVSSPTQTGMGSQRAGLIVASASTVLTARYLVKNKAALAKCGATSMKLLMYGGVLAAAGEVTSNVMYKGALRKAVKNYQERVTAEKEEYKSGQEYVEESHQNQIEAFNFLIEQEKAKRTALQVRGGGHAVAGALYTASAVMAAVEIFKSMTTFGASAATDTCPAVTSYENPFKDTKIYVYQPHYQKSNFEMQMFNFEREMEELIAAIEEKDNKTFYQKIFQIIGVDSAIASDSYQNNDEKLHQGMYGNSTGGDILGELTTIVGAGGPAYLAAGNGFVSDKILGTAFSTSIGRGVYSVVLAGYSSLVSVDSFKKASRSKDRIESIEEIKKNFQTSPTTLAGCTVADRKDSSKPACYCYNDNNEQNMARSNQQVCKTQWGEINIAGATDYNQSGTSSSNNNVCLSTTYKVDESCTCRGGKGKDACLKFGNISGFNDIGAASYGGSLQDLANQVTSGNYNSGNALAQAGNNLAMKGKQIAEQMAKQNKDADKVLKTINSQASKLQNAHSRAMGSSGNNNMANRSPFDATPLSNIDPKKAVAEVEKSIAAAQAYDAGKAQAKKSAADDNMNFDFGGGSSQGSVVVEDDLNEVMDKDFNYAENDINNRPGDSIFKILTLRYQTSGLRRLFDDKNEFQAEAASGKEIHGN